MHKYSKKIPVRFSLSKFALMLCAAALLGACQSRQTISTATSWQHAKWTVDETVTEMDQGTPPRDYHLKFVYDDDVSSTPSLPLSVGMESWVRKYKTLEITDGHVACWIFGDGWEGKNIRGTAEFKDKQGSVLKSVAFASGAAMDCAQHIKLFLKNPAVSEDLFSRTYRITLNLEGDFRGCERGAANQLP